MRKIVLGILFCGAAGLLLSQARLRPEPLSRFPPDIVPDLSRDIVTVARQQYSVDLENDQTRVLRAKLRINETVPPHDAQQGVLVAVTQTRLSLIGPDNRARSVDLEPGKTQWIAEHTYSIKNVTGRAVEYVFIEMKRRSTGNSIPDRVR
jgi:hypothetical protein